MFVDLLFYSGGGMGKFFVPNVSPYVLFRFVLFKQVLGGDVSHASCKFAWIVFAISFIVSVVFYGYC